MAHKTIEYTEALDVLVVDDDPDHRWLTRDAIAHGNKPCRVFEAGSANEALAMLANGGEDSPWVNPNVIYLDVNMPGMDGLSLLDRIKSDPDLRDIMVVIVTGGDVGAELREKAMHRGADAFIEKTADARAMMVALLNPIEQYPTSYHAAENSEGTPCE